MTHKIPILPDAFQLIKNGHRKYVQVGRAYNIQPFDTLVLNEWLEVNTGNSLEVIVTDYEYIGNNIFASINLLNK